MPERLTFLVQGSQPDPYEVTFIRRDPGNLSAYCTCRAGENGQHCKHRVRLLIGDETDLVGGDTSEVATLESWLRGSDIEHVMQKVRDAEVAAEQAKKALREAKKRLARAMVD